MSRHSAIALLTLLVAALFPPTRSTAAEEPQSTRPGARPQATPDFLPSTPPAGFELPPVDDTGAAVTPQGESVFVKGFAFDGNQKISTAELQAFVAPFSNRTLTEAALEELRQRLSRLYVEKGYVNSGALLDDGFYRDQVVHFRIIEGRLTDIRLKNEGRLHASYIEHRLMPRAEVLNVDVMRDRFALLLTDPLFSSINARLVPGDELGKAALEVDVARARAWDLALFANNYQPPSIGAEAAGLNGAVRNLTGFGDTLDGVYQHGFEGASRYGLDWTLPIPRSDLVFGARYDYSESTIIEEPLDTLDIKSEYKGWEVNLGYKLREAARERLELGLNYGHRQNRTLLLDTPFSFVSGESTGTSKIRALRFYQDYVQRRISSVLALRSTFTSGTSNSSGDAAVQAPDKKYFLWVGQAQYAHLLTAGGTEAVARLNVQWTGDRLMPLERFAAGGASAVRGYRENQLVRDRGYSLSIDLRIPVLGSQADRGSVHLIPFVDYARAGNKDEKSETLTSVGLGLGFRYAAFTGNLYYGHALKDPAIDSSGDLQDSGVHFNMRFEF